jgi:integrase
VSSHILITENKELKDYDGYKLVKDTIKSHQKGLCTEQAEILEDEVVIAILNRYPEEDKHLMLKTFFVIGIFAAFRVDEIYKITRENVRIDENSKRIYINLSDSKAGPCLSTIPGLSKNIEGCPFRIVKSYSCASSSGDCSIVPFWFKWIKNDRGGYFGKQRVGINTMRTWLSEILSHPEIVKLLPSDVKYEIETGERHCSNKSSRIGIKRYTGHSLRRTCATLLAKMENVKFDEIQKLGRWKSPAVAQKYIENNPESKARTTIKLIKYLDTGEKEQEKEEKGLGFQEGANFKNAKKVVYIENANNITINL